MRLIGIALVMVMLFLSDVRTNDKPAGITFSQQWWVNDVRAAAWSPNGDQIAIASTEGGITLYNTRSGTALYKLTELSIEPDPPRFQLSWSPDGQLLAGRSKQTDKARVWNTASDQLLNSFPWGGSPLAFSPNGQFLAGLNEDGQIVFWDPSAKELKDISLKRNRDSFDAFVFSWSPNGASILFGAAAGVDLSVFDLSTKAIRFQLQIADGGLRQGGWTPDGKYIFAVSQAKTLHRWHTNDGTPLAPFSFGGSMVSFSPDGRYFAANYHAFPYDDDHPPWNVVYIYDAQTFEEVGRVDHPATTEYVRWLAWSPDGDYLATVTHSTSRLYIWRRVIPD